ncbi:MAG: ricin-type beta-trefoil lectin domain protein [Gemmatirosa sp.]|nr:ricin-type beta-trefoil lectin domain protein [Gemmatirosa sp.]
MHARPPRQRVAVAAALSLLAITCTDSPTRTTAPDAAPTLARSAAPAPLAGGGATTAVTVQVPASMRSAPFNVTRTLNVPSGYGVRVYARIAGARFMAAAPNGDLLVSNPGAGKVYLVRPDANGDGVITDWVTGLHNPHDIVFHTLGGVTYVYVAESDKIGRYVYNANGTPGARQTLISGLPDNTSGALKGAYGHQLKNIALDGNKLYVSVASPSNADPADLARTPKGAAIYLYDATGGGQRLFAQGLRNAEGLAIAPGTSTLWVAVNNRDNIAYPYHQDFDGNGSDDYGKVMQAYVDNHPPEELTSVRDGGNYGWPLCNPNPDTPNGMDDMPFDRDVQNNPNGTALDCSTADRIAKGIQAHSAPLGLTFWVGANVPSAYAGGVLVGLHGSWNRSVPTGYKIAYFPWSGGRPGAQVDLVTGWLTGGTWGRPVDLAVAPDGGLYISDDYSGTIYRLVPNAPPPPPPGGAGTLVPGAGYGCLSTYGGQRTTHTSVSVVTCATGAAGQTWTPPASGTTGLVSAFGGAICLSAYGTASGAAVGTDPCNAAAASQQWTRSATDELKTSAGLCATALRAGNAAVALKPCTGATSQRWTPG